MRHYLKGSFIFSALFIAIAFIASTICSVFLPPWASVTTIVVSIISFAVVNLLIILKRNPNRTETIHDDESGNTVLNHYDNNLLVKSVMKNKRGIVIYELFYRDDVISQSKSYDESGSLKIEQSYYDNGQVHFRDEFRKDGKYSSEFERNGNKK